VDTVAPLFCGCTLWQSDVVMNNPPFIVIFQLKPPFLDKAVAAGGYIQCFTLKQRWQWNICTGVKTTALAHLGYENDTGKLKIQAASSSFIDTLGVHLNFFHTPTYI
jgi:hypothetical protein